MPNTSPSGTSKVIPLSASTRCGPSPNVLTSSSVRNKSVPSRDGDDRARVGLVDEGRDLGALEDLAEPLDAGVVSEGVGDGEDVGVGVARRLLQDQRVLAGGEPGFEGDVAVDQAEGGIRERSRDLGRLDLAEGEVLRVVDDVLLGDRQGLRGGVAVLVRKGDEACLLEEVEATGDVADVVREQYQTAVGHLVERGE